MLSSVGRGGRYRSQSIGSGDNNKTIGPTLGGGCLLTCNGKKVNF